MKCRYRIFLLISVTFFASIKLQAQVNAYAKVTAISGTTLTLSNVNETYHTFENGDKIIIMQMQDDVIGNVTNASTFGALGSIKSAGLYEVTTIASHTESAGLPSTITVSTTLTNTFNIGTNSTVQLISFRKYGSPDYTTTADMIAMDWNGTVGGVIAIEVSGILTLAHNLTANGAGFIGGLRSGAGSSSLGCDASTWITSNSATSGGRGESIYKITNTAYMYGRAKGLSGGGGGNLHNAGGGGGGNYTAGGDGGAGYLCTASPVGGQGGISLNTSINANRIFMGGGGGGAHQNNNAATAGSDGGGIILVSAKQIVTSGSCGAIKISANGGTATAAANDGAGGGGAGGSIVLAINNFNIAPGCTLAVSANGGNGGSVSDSQAHGGGGGGGQGVVIYPSAQPSANIITTTASGTGGCNSSSCATLAATATGTSNSGIVTNVGSTPLPVSLLYFKGLYNDQSHTVELRWATASEINSDYFTLERSANGEQFVTIGTINGNGTSQLANKYEFTDDGVKTGVYYYRLSQTDLDGTTVRFKIIRIELDGPSEPFTSVYPNPVTKGGAVTIDLIDVPNDTYTISILDRQGIEITKTQLTISQLSTSVTIPLDAVGSGVYIVRITSSGLSTNRKLVIR